MRKTELEGVRVHVVTLELHKFYVVCLTIFSSSSLPFCAESLHIGLVLKSFWLQLSLLDLVSKPPFPR